VQKAVALSGQPPDFQRFPVLVKASEAERNYLVPNSSATLTASQLGMNVKSGPIVGPNGKLMESQKVYVGSLDPSVTQEHLFVLFRQFGQLEKVAIQMEPSTGISKGFAFLSFHDPKEANLAIQTMSNQVLAGRHMKTGWATNQVSSNPGIEVVTSDEFPTDASARAQKAFQVLAQLALGVPVSSIGQATTTSAPTAAAAAPGGSSRIPTVAEARASLAGAAPTQAPIPVAPVAPATTPAGAVAAAAVAMGMTNVDATQI